MAATDAQRAWVLRVLGQQTGTAQEDAGASLAELGLQVSDIWNSARSAFRDATAAVDGQIGGLQSALRNSYDPDLMDIAELGLNGLTKNTRVRLMAALMEAGGGSAAELKQAAPKLTKAIDAFRSVITTDQRVAACDNNPFGVRVAIADTYRAALGQLEYAVRLAA